MRFFLFLRLFREKRNEHPHDRLLTFRRQDASKISPRLRHLDRYAGVFSVFGHDSRHIAPSIRGEDRPENLKPRFILRNHGKNIKRD